MPVIDTWRGERFSEETKAFVGWDGLIINDEGVEVLDLLRSYMERAAEESCGQCFPCRSGLKRVAQRLGDMCKGEARDDDIEYLRSLADLVFSSARCDIGQTSPQALLDVIKEAPHLLKAKKIKPGKYTSLVTAPCINACPSHVDIPTYIEKIRFREFGEGLEAVMKDCPMPGTIGRVCERPCETACKRGVDGPPVAIRHLKRFLYDQHARDKEFYEEQKQAQGAKKIAVVGAGPAGLSCAYYLSQLGFAPTIFERQTYAGGMAKFGIPDYRLPPPILQREADIIASYGTEIKYGVDIGRDKKIKDLEKEGFEAIFIGSGAPDAPGMHCEGSEACDTGYISGIHYLSEATKGRRAVTGERLIIVGGGNVAMDCARSARRLGFKDVQVLYRRTEAEMPADKDEIKEAREEGVTFNFLAAPLRIHEEDGALVGLVCQKMKLGEPDASGRRRPVPMEGETYEMACDAVIHAIGQSVAVEDVLDGLVGGLNEYKNLAADDITGKVHDFPNIYGGGDCVSGPESLIAALADGKRAAYHIAAQLTGVDHGPTSKEKLEVALMSIDMLQGEDAPIKNYTKAMPVHTIPVSERLDSFIEVETPSRDWEATNEASRCLRCFRIAMIAD